MKIKQSKEEVIFDVINLSVLTLLGCIMLIPLLSVLATSFSHKIAEEAGKVYLFPVDFTLASWKYIISKADLWRAFFTTLIATVIGTTLSLILTTLLAYPLSKKEFMLARILGVMVVITMVFKAPIIPYFLTVKQLGLYDNFWVLVLPHSITAYNMIIMRSFLKGIPKSLEECAKIDGAGYFRTLISVVVPMSKPVLATLGLFYSVMIWNQFLHPILFIQSQKIYPLQLKLRQYISTGEEFVGMTLDEVVPYNDATLKAATIIFAVIPIILVYPYIQKYFVKGAMLGAIKG